MRNHRLLVGYGNELRGDDAVGPQLARAVAERKLAGVVAVAVHQLLPELVELVQAAQEVFFVDAGCISLGDPRGGFTVQPLEAGKLDPGMGHISDPRWLLGLTGALHRRCPPAWLVSIHVESFAFGAPLTALAQAGMVGALDWILSRL